MEEENQVKVKGKATNGDTDSKLMEKNEREHYHSVDIGDQDIDGKNVQDRDKKLLELFEKKFKSLQPLPTGCCIYKVPKLLREVKESFYVPRIVSIGPIHLGENSLQEMEEHKLRYLNHFRARKENLDLKDCLDKLRKEEESARGCYGDNKSFINDDFVLIMLVDGCFIVELLLRTCKDDDQIFKDDPIFNTSWWIKDLRRDMLLLENQLPFSVLQCLYNLILDPNNQKQFPSLAKLTYDFFENIMEKYLEKYLENQDPNPERKDHFLDLLRNCFLPKQLEPCTSGKTKQKFRFPPCVTKLKEAGVKIKKSGEDKSLLEITFDSREGVLEIPRLRIDDMTETLFRNLIALEQCRQDHPSYITDYALLLDSLISTPEDVALLSHYGIINNCIGHEEGVSLLFNTLFKGVIWSSRNYYYGKLCEDLNHYSKVHWHQWMANLKKDYFNTPWAIISFFAAVVLLSLTLIQTICSLLALQELE